MTRRRRAEGAYADTVKRVSSPDLSHADTPSETVTDQAALDAAKAKIDTVWESDGKPMFLDREGQPLTLRRWSELRGDQSYKNIERTIVGPHEVITVWLGIDQGDGLDGGPPLIFGTISRNIEENFFDGGRERFAANELDARHNHHRLVVTLTAEV